MEQRRTDDLERWLKTEEVSRITGLSDNHLRKIRCLNPDAGPRFVKVGRSVRYPQSELRSWMAARLAGGRS